ncbi:hypothetical protein [Maribacter arcticus]|uniref:Uncharacterized protein n=1 Tax=Maribacter arcticus TaxID=561365 RepID=A0A1T5CH18_9FLAO|nr:hypothetical protein [Maribacter arcticus]SKB58611.1 hypothetical protein SAMN05660866_02283 [Maribacter arcticus]
MGTGQTKSEHQLQLEKWHWDCQHWKSTLQFVDDEMVFLERLMNSYLYQPNTPDHFERVQDYQERLKKLKAIKLEVRNSISKHENKLGGILEVLDCEFNLQLSQKHEVLKAQVVDCSEIFKDLKFEINDYTTNILKNRKLKD